MEEEDPGDLGAQEGGHQEHGGDDQAEPAWLLLPQQHEASDNLYKVLLISVATDISSVTSQNFDLQFLITVSISGADITSGWIGVNVSLSSSVTGGTLRKIIVSLHRA